MDLKDLTDAELLQKMLPESAEAALELEPAWQEFFHRCYPFLHKMIRNTLHRCSPNHNVAEDEIADLVQHIFTKLFENDYKVLRELKIRCTGSVRSYLIAVGVNLVIDYLRSANSLRNSAIIQSINEPASLEESYQQSDRLLARSGNPEENFFEKEMIAEALEVVAAESSKAHRERNQRIFLLAYRDGYTRTEIAAIKELDLKRAGINSLFISLLPHIKKKLQKFYNF